jgi:hypothetical protein
VERRHRGKQKKVIGQCWEAIVRTGVGKGGGGGGEVCGALFNLLGLILASFRRNDGGIWVGALRVLGALILKILFSGSEQV